MRRVAAAWAWAFATALCAAASAQQPGGVPAAVRALPLVERPAPAGRGRTLALVMSGDGDWAHFIRQLGDSLAVSGLPVVGLESRSYLSRPRSPEELAADLQPALRYYMARWSADSLLVVGYSRGADFAPFLVNRLPTDLRSKVVAVALLSPSRRASFEFHLLDLVRATSRPSDLATMPEVEAMMPIRLLCVYGTEDTHSLCPDLPAGSAEVLEEDAGHRLHSAADVARAVTGLLSASRPPGSLRSPGP